MAPDDTPPRVLYLTHRVPFPPDKGDRIRNYHVLRQLARRTRVWLVALADEPVTEEGRKELERLCERVAIVSVRRSWQLLRAGFSALKGRSLTEGAFHSDAVNRQLAEWAGEVRAALVSTVALAPYLRRGRLTQVPAFVDLVDVDSQKWLDFAAASRGPRRWLYRFEGSRLRRLEAGLPGWTQGNFLVSRAEAKVFEAFAGEGTAIVATNGVDLEYYQPSPETPSEPACAFVGALDYLPNIDAAIWFAESVWPEVRRQRPEAEFWVIGRKPVPAVQALSEQPGVKIIGQVPDVRPYLTRAAVVVVPMRLSRGLQNKVLEGLAMGKAVIAAPPALAALTTEPGTHLLAARTPEEWVRTVVELLGSPERRQQLGEAGRRFVEEHHHWDRCLQPLVERVLAPILPDTRVARPPAPRAAGPGSFA